MKEYDQTNPDQDQQKKYFTSIALSGVSFFSLRFHGKTRLI